MTTWDIFWKWVASDEFRSIMLVVGAIIAVVSVHTSRVIARKKQVADILFSRDRDQQLADGHKAIREILNSDNDNIASFARADRMSDPRAVHLRYVLNHYEHIAVCVQSGIFDEEMLRQAMYGTITRLFKTVKPFIDELRKDPTRATVFQEFQWLAMRWNDKPLAVKKCAKH